MPNNNQIDSDSISDKQRKSLEYIIDEWEKSCNELTNSMAKISDNQLNEIVNVRISLKSAIPFGAK